jgi:hypothetical protein
MIGWAQSTEEPPVEQVGEGAGEDVETLDEAETPADDVAPEEDIETLDEGSPPVAADEDLELLDQGAPPGTSPAPVTETSAPTTVTAEPVTTDAVPEPVAASGPMLPEGFGTGSVHVSTGSAGFPTGLENCHVGAVTGRAFVGINCGDGSSFVGHAPSFEEFPFVVDEGFPFNQEGIFADLSEDVEANDAEILVSAARGAPLGDDNRSPEVRTTGDSSVQLTQEARKRKPRVETGATGSRQTRDTKNKGNNDVGAAARDDGNDRMKGNNAEGRKRNGNQEEKSRASAGENKKKSPEQSAKKEKKARGSKKR